MKIVNNLPKSRNDVRSHSGQAFRAGLITRGKGNPSDVEANMEGLQQRARHPGLGLLIHGFTVLFDPGINK